MAEKPIKTPLPANLPEDWNAGQIVAPTGEEVGLSHQHGYNYLMEMVNRTQQSVNQISDAFETISSGAARRVVGTSISGWTLADCDFLCDGTNDQVEIRQALAALGTYGGEVILLPGTYYLGGALEIKEKQWLHGVSPKTVKIVRTTASGVGEKNSIISVNGGKLSAFTFSGFDTVSNDTFDIGVRTGGYISNIIFGPSAQKDSIYISGTVYESVTVCDCEWGFVEAAIFADAVSGALAIYNNRCNGANKFIEMTAAPKSSGGASVYIVGNRIDDGGNCYLDGLSRIGGNIVRGNHFSTISILNTPGAYMANSGNIVSGNVFVGPGDGGSAALILGENTTGWFVTGNVLFEVDEPVDYYIEDHGTGNVVRFNSDDIGSGGSTAVKPGPQGEPGKGVPTGGAAGQVLAKKSSSDYDTEWTTIDTAGSSTGGVSMSEVSSAISNATKNMVTSTSVCTIETMTEAAYNALTAKSADTLYLIEE